jgi:hypothetical protein
VKLKDCYIELEEIKGKLFLLKDASDLFIVKAKLPSELDDTNSIPVKRGTVVLATGRTINWDQIHESKSDFDFIAFGLGVEYEVLVLDKVGFLPKDILEELKCRAPLTKS